MILGLGFALVCALGTNLSALFKARGAVLARPIRARHPLRSATDLFRQRWFAIGWILALFAWGLHIEALAPLSTVQAVLSGGLVFLAVLAERFFGYHLGRRQWLGVTLTAAGLAVIGLTATAEGPQRSSSAALIAVETGILGLGVGLVRISTRRGIEHRRESLLLAIAAGVLFGVSDVAIKYLTHATGPVFDLLSPWTLTALISFVVSFYASARSLQIGLAIEVIAITSVAANLSAIVGASLSSASRLAPARLGSSVVCSRSAS
jgi:drug/metabolite transporter (DMT)-like permease